MDWEAFYNSFRKPGFIPGYEIQNRLGGGAFGDVYKARKTSIGKAYAIKFLKLEDDAQRDAVERELAQVRHFAAIDHPNLVTIEDLGSVLDVPYLVMGYAGEDTLARRLKGGALPLDEALLVFTQAARGVLALHDRRLVHFDLKPSNIFLKGDVARVGDYGLSKLLEGGRMTLSIGRGTPQYMAPEILRSRADHRADIYSLGVILFESLTGELPYKGDGGGLVIREEDDPPVFPDGCQAPPVVRDAVCRALRLDPADRFADVGELLDAIGQTARPGDSVTFIPGVEGEAQSAPTPASSDPPSKPQSSRLAAAIAAERAALARHETLSSASEPPTPSSRARALAQTLAMNREDAEREESGEGSTLAPPAPPALEPGPVPVPPRVSGGIVGAAIATSRIGVEVLLALTGGILRATVTAWRRLVDRLVRKKGNAIGRAGRFVLFLAVMATAGFVVTLLGMLGLMLLEQAGGA